MFENNFDYAAGVCSSCTKHRFSSNRARKVLHKKKRRPWLLKGLGRKRMFLLHLILNNNVGYKNFLRNFIIHSNLFRQVMKNKEPHVQKVYAKMAQLCSRSEQCSADIRKKILASGISEDLADEMLDELIREKYIDNQRYANAYVNDKFKINKWGKIKIKHNLRRKGIAENIIENSLSNIDDGKYEILLVKTMKTKARSIKSKDKFQKMAQLIRYTQGRGFEPQLIHKHINKVLD